MRNQNIDPIRPKMDYRITGFGSYLQRNNFTSYCENFPVQLKPHDFPSILERPIVQSGSLEPESLSGQVGTWPGLETTFPFGLL